VIISFFAAGIALFFSGIACVIAGFWVILQSFPTTLFYLGSGLVLLGIGAAAIIATAKLSKICFNWLTKKVGGFILRRKAT